MGRVCPFSALYTSILGIDSRVFNIPDDFSYSGYRGKSSLKEKTFSPVGTPWEPTVTDITYRASTFLNGLSRVPGWLSQ